jgi:UDP-2,3-diacylglucosamine pyrophosphatase LpxH
MKRTILGILVLAVTLSAVVPLVAVADNSATISAQNRATVVISDLHMGLGRRADKSWDPMEDFRWEGALRQFLDYISKKYEQRVDLVIAGDFLELWQPPKSVRCKGNDANHGCTIPEMKEIVRHVTAAHQGELAALADFTKGDTNQNKVHIIPGNHDSALVLPEIWQMMAKAMPAANGRVALVANGVWTSADGEVLVEHGHQIGSDVNRYKKWPKITERRKGKDYIVRPWGELFVQRLFNEEESRYPIIDNLSPETAGARYRMADRGLWGSVTDVARFIAFNIFETSAAQKATSLGKEPGSSKPCTREEAEALGHRLVLGTLKPDDPFRQQAEDKSPEAQRLRNELDALVKSLPDEDIQHLCARQIDATTLGAVLESTFVPRKEIIQNHLQERIATYPKTAIFVYGHTHQYENAWDVKLNADRTVTVLNSGAFQRLLDEAGYLKRVADLGLNDSKHEGLSRIELDTLAPCYGVVLIERHSGVPVAETKMWYAPEGGIGKPVDPGSESCK